jgi:hypothetical protein
MHRAMRKEDVTTTHLACVVTQQTVNNNSYNYSPNYSIFPEVIRDTLVSCDWGATVVTYANVRSCRSISSLKRCMSCMSCNVTLHELHDL